MIFIYSPAGYDMIDQGTLSSILAVAFNHVTPQGVCVRPRLIDRSIDRCCRCFCRAARGATHLLLTFSMCRVYVFTLFLTAAAWVSRPAVGVSEEYGGDDAHADFRDRLEQAEDGISSEGSRFFFLFITCFSRVV